MMKKELILVLSIIGVMSLGYWYNRTNVKKPCQCFCAFKQDLRDKQEKDRPFIATLTNSKGKTFDICLCAQRDLDHLQENPSLVDQITDDIIAGANCCSQ